MGKTSVDGMLIEMMTLKVKEVEEKFGRDDGLTQGGVTSHYPQDRTHE